MARKSAKEDRGISAVGEISPPMSLGDVEAKVDPDLEEGDADLEDVRALGAVSAESAARNAQTKDVIAGKRDRSRRIRWNEDNAQLVYDSIRQAGWNTASSYISCKRVTGEPAQWSTTCSAIPNGDALYSWCAKVCHKTSPGATYEIRIIDSHTNQERGRGKLYMPDTLSDAQPQPLQPPQMQPQPNPYAQYAQYTQQLPPPPWYPGMPHQPPPQAAPAAAPPQAPPAPPQAPPAQASGEVADLRAQVGFLSGQLAQLLAQKGMPVPPPLAPQITVVGPPAAAASPPAAAAPAAQQPIPQPGAGAPPGLVHVPGMGYINAELVASSLMSTMRRQFEPPAPPAPRPMPPPAPPGGAPPSASPAPMGHLGGLPIPAAESPTIASMMNTHARNMRETAAGLSAMVSAADDIRASLSPEKDDDATPAAAAPKQPNGDPAKKPFEVLDAGPVRVPYNPETGDMKGIANLLMVNADKIGGFVGKLYEKVAVAAAAQASAAAQSAAQGGKTFTPPPSLPNGTATPGWPPSPTLPRA